MKYMFFVVVVGLSSTITMTIISSASLWQWLSIGLYALLIICAILWEKKEREERERDAGLR